MSQVDSITKTLVMRVGQSLPDDIARSLEASVYEGVSGYIIMQREYFIDWTCDYELTYYPFDTQVRSLFVRIRMCRTNVTVSRCVR